MQTPYVPVHDVQEGEVVKREFTHTPIIKADVVEGEVDFLDFYGALKRMYEGKKVSRKEWEGTGVYGVFRKDTLMIFMDGKDGKTFYKWIIKTADLAASDWIVI